MLIIFVKIQLKHNSKFQTKKNCIIRLLWSQFKRFNLMFALIILRKKMILFYLQLKSFHFFKINLHLKKIVKFYIVKLQG